MAIFNNIAKLQYESTVGGLPGWAFLVIFLIALGVAKSGTHQEFDSGKEVQNGWFFSTILAIGTTIMAFIGDWFRKGMFGARTKMYKGQGMNNGTAKATAMQTQQFANLSSKLSGLKK